MALMPQAELDITAELVRSLLEEQLQGQLLSEPH